MLENILDWYKGPLTKKHIAELRLKLAKTRGVLEGIKNGEFISKKEIEAILKDTADS